MKILAGKNRQLSQISVSSSAWYPDEALPGILDQIPSADFQNHPTLDVHLSYDYPSSQSYVFDLMIAPHDHWFDLYLSYLSH